MKGDLSDSEVRRKLEQMRGIGYAQSLTDALISTMKGEVEARKSDEELNEED